jgi:methyl-accepting chemotaxis protein
LSKGTAQQSVGMHEITKAIHLISNSTEESTTLSGETQTVSGKVEIEANALRNTVENLDILFNG